MRRRTGRCIRSRRCRLTLTRPFRWCFAGRITAIDGLATAATTTSSATPRRRRITGSAARTTAAAAAATRVSGSRQTGRTAGRFTVACRTASFLLAAAAAARVRIVVVKVRVGVAILEHVQLMHLSILVEPLALFGRCHSGIIAMTVSTIVVVQQRCGQLTAGRCTGGTAAITTAAYAGRL